MASDAPEYDDREKAELEALVESRPLSEARITATLRRARRDVSFLQRHRVLVKIAAATMLVLLASAGWWHWSGVNSLTTLSFERGIEVLLEASDYDPVNRESALGRVDFAMEQAVQKLQESGDFQPFVRDGLRACFDSPPIAVPYSGPFEQIAALAGQQPLTYSEHLELLRALSAGVLAIRSLRTVDMSHDEVVGVFETRWRTRLGGR